MDLVALTGFEVAQAFGQLKQRLRTGATESDLTVIPSASAGKSRAYWHEAEGIWTVLEPDDDEGRFWCMYGLVNPTEKQSQRSVVQVNVSQGGLIWLTAGAFAKDAKGQFYYVHNGQQVRSQGKTFAQEYQGERATIAWPNHPASERFVIGRLNERQFVAKLAAYVRAVNAFRNGTTDKGVQEAISEGLDAGIKEAQAAITAAREPTPSEPLPDDPEVREAVAFATKRVERLGQVKEWLGEDPELLQGIVGTVKKKGAAAQRRSAVVSVLVAVLSLVAGWLLSGINPATIVGPFVGR